MGELIDRERERALLREAATGSAEPRCRADRPSARRQELPARRVRWPTDGRRSRRDEQPERGHLDLLAARSARSCPATPPLRFATGTRRSRSSASRRERGPLAVVLDEFQWLCAAQPALDSTSNAHWDRWQRDDVPLMLVLSGSALTLMEELLSTARRSTVARRRGRFPDPARLPRRRRLRRDERARRRCCAATRCSAARRSTRPGRAIGRSSGSSREAHSSKGAAALRGAAATCCARAKASATRARTSRSCARSPRAPRSTTRSQRGAGSPTGNLTKLDATRAARLRRAPCTARARRAASGRASYRIADPFFRFWFRYVFPNRSRLERGRVEEVPDEIVADLDNLMGRAFEDCCREWVGRYADERRSAPARSSAAGGRATARPRSTSSACATDRYELLGSCKWRRTRGRARARRAARGAGGARRQGGQCADWRSSRAAASTPRCAAAPARRTCCSVTAAELFAPRHPPPAVLAATDVPLAFKGHERDRGTQTRHALAGEPGRHGRAEGARPRGAPASASASRRGSRSPPPAARATAS